MNLLSVEHSIERKKSKIIYCGLKCPFFGISQKNGVSSHEFLLWKRTYATVQTG